jgi:PilZ domain
MRAYDNDKRNWRRVKQEFVVGVKTTAGLQVAYTIDVSRDGVKIGSPVLQLPLGGQVDVVIDRQGEKHPFSGRVVRDDGHYYIDRIRRSVTAFFIRIDDGQFNDFAFENFFV